MLLRPADLLYGPMGNREVDLQGRSARLDRCETETSEQTLGDPVVSPVFEQSAPAPVGQAALAAMTFDQPPLLEGRHVREGRRRGEMERRRDELERGPSLRRLLRADRLEGLELSTRQPL
jgi:hypothetical protein